MDVFETLVKVKNKIKLHQKHKLVIQIKFILKRFINEHPWRTH